MDGPAGLIDVHCHILPALDDGALDLADSLAMARQAHSDGIAVVCATPHIRDDHDVRIEELPDRIAALQAELDRAEIPVQIASGGEVGQHAAQRLDRKALRRVALGGRAADGPRPWILLEPAPGPLCDDLPRLAERLREQGLGVVVAHPERHAGEDFMRRLGNLVDAGCLVQWTAAFLAAPRQSDLTLTLARAGLVHLLGSDAHSSHGGRPVHIRAGIERLRAGCTPEQHGWIAHAAPAAVLRGEPVTLPWHR